MKKLTLYFSFLFLNASLCLLKAQPQPWQMIHNTDRHGGYANVVGPKTNAIKWKYHLGTAGPAFAGNSIAISSTGIIYTGGPNKITSLTSKGALRWAFSAPGAQGPCISDDGKHIYFVDDSAITCCDSNGVLSWRYLMPNIGLFGPTLSHDGTMLYQGCWDHNVYAISTNGIFKWKYLTNGCVSYPVALTPGGTVIVGGGDAHCGNDSCVYGLDGANGALKWKYVTTAQHCGGPVVGLDGLIYLPAQPKLYVLDTLGNFLWSIGAPKNVAGIIPPGLYADSTTSTATIYVGNANGRFYSINGGTKDTTWAYQTGADPSIPGFYGVPSFPVVDNQGSVYFGSVDYKVYALDKTGSLKWSYTTGNEISEASPALGPDGTLYVNSTDGWLYAFGDTIPTGKPELIINNQELRIYPNPSNGRFTIQITNSFKLTANSSVEVYSMLGEKVYSNSFSTFHSPFSIDLSGLSNGVYMLKLQAGDGTEAVKKVSIVR